MNFSKYFDKLLFLKYHLWLVNEYKSFGLFVTGAKQNALMIVGEQGLDMCLNDVISCLILKARQTLLEDGW